MSKDLANLILALYQEHKDRTGHDPLSIHHKDRPERALCAVCIYLEALLKSAFEYHPPEPAEPK